jgi:DNA-binding response OmpR family regulator
MSLVLVVEDDPAIRLGLKDNLECEGHNVLTASDGQTGYRMARERKPDLTILDLMMPKMNGLDVCRNLRAEGFQSMILVLTARGEESDRVLGLDLGADDYITKPFSIRELLARARALLRRARAVAALPAELRVGDVVVDFLRYQATKAGAPLKMTRKEFGVLRLLAAKAGEVLTRDDLLNDVWGLENYPSTRTVDNHITSLRKMIDDPAAPSRIITIHGVGYRLLVKPE